MSRPTDFVTFSRPASSAGGATRSPLPPPRTAVLLTDTLEAPAQFALLQFVHRALRPQSQNGMAGGYTGRTAGQGRRKVVIIGVKEKEEYWAALLRKNGIQLPSEIAAGRFSFVDASSPSQPFSSLYTSICGMLRTTSSDEEGEGALVIVDDLSALAWRGDGVRDVVNWWRAVKAAVDATDSSLISLLHADSLSPSFPPNPSSTAFASTPFEDPEDQYLFRQILQHNDAWIEVTGLSTGGGAGGTRGEITVHRGPALLEESLTLDPIPPIQYKLEDAGAAYEVKGIGRFL
ncbi:hypothetical protein JCM11641_004330 [Rhodosporidiobolus odoratus]